jgi:hypothetical protein
LFTELFKLNSFEYDYVEVKLQTGVIVARWFWSLAGDGIAATGA